MGIRQAFLDTHLYIYINIYDKGITRTCTFHVCFCCSFFCFVDYRKMTRYDATGDGKVEAIVDCLPQKLVMTWLKASDSQEACVEQKETMKKMQSLQGNLSFKKKDVEIALKMKAETQQVFKNLAKECDLKKHDSKTAKLCKSSVTICPLPPPRELQNVQNHTRWFLGRHCIKHNNPKNELRILAKRDLCWTPKCDCNLWDFSSKKFIDRLYNADLLEYPWIHGYPHGHPESTYGHPWIICMDIHWAFICIAEFLVGWNGSPSCHVSHPSPKPLPPHDKWHAPE